MKGIRGLFLGIFGTFAFSWVGLLFIPNLQIGHLDPQMDEEGTDVYPAPRSGMAERGRRIYVANGCVYCHSQQVRADYAAADIDRKWGERRSAPRDYIFDRPALLGKMRMGPDLSNAGKRSPIEDANPAPAAGGAPAPAAGAPAANSASPAPASSPVASPGMPSSSPAANGGPVNPPVASPAAALAGNSAPAASPVVSPAAGSPQAPGSMTPAAPGVPQPANATAAQATTAAPASANVATSAASSADIATGPGGAPIPYSAPWHHRHLYSPRSINLDSNMPSFAFLYEKRKISGAPAADALKLSGADAPDEGMEIVPTYDAKCLVAYIMSLDQSHPLKEVKSVTPASPPAPAKGVK